MSALSTGSRNASEIAATVQNTYFRLREMIPFNFKQLTWASGRQ